MRNETFGSRVRTFCRFGALGTLLAVIANVGVADIGYRRHELLDWIEVVIDTIRVPGILSFLAFGSIAFVARPGAVKPRSPRDVLVLILVVAGALGALGLSLAYIVGRVRDTPWDT